METITGVRVFENEDYLVIQKSLFKNSLWMFLFSSIYIQSKQTLAATKATGSEKRFWLCVVGELTKVGVIPSSPEFEFMMESFCNAVLTRGGARWKLFFHGKTPKEAALMFI